MTNPKHTSSDLVAEIRKEAAIQIGFDGPAYQTLTRWADRIEALEAENERLQEACERVKCAAVATAKIRLAKRERELEVCGSNMSRAKMKCRADEAAILLGELRALDVAAIIGDGHD